MIGHENTALDCRGIPDGGSIFVLGDKAGKISLRIDWEESIVNYYGCLPPKSKNFV